MLNIEQFENPICNFDYFSADFIDDKMYFNKKEYPLGYITNCVLNISNEDMTKLLFLGAEIKQYVNLFNVYGYIKNAYEDARDKIINLIEVLKEYEPFKLFNTDESVDTVKKLFSDSKLDEYEEFFNSDSKTTDDNIEKFYIAKKDFGLTKEILKVYSYIILDTANFCTVAMNYVHNIMTNNARRPEELAEIAHEFFNDKDILHNIISSNPAQGQMDGFEIKPKQSVVPTIRYCEGSYSISRRVYFGRLMDFYVTEFFEALAHGHYSWQCKICNRYFLKTTAHAQLYCSDVNPQYGVPCSHIAKHPEITKSKMQKQKKCDSPYYPIYKKRYDSIRRNKSKGKYSAEISTKAKAIIDRNLERTQFDFDYAKYQYEDDMVLTKIYEEAIKDE